MKKKGIALVLCGVMALSVPVYAKGGSVSLSSDELQVPKTEQKKTKKESRAGTRLSQSHFSEAD